MRRPPLSTRTDALFPDTTLFRSPVANDIQAIVGGNDRGVRRSYGLRPNEILIDPRQPVATRSRNFRAHNWLKTDVDRKSTRRTPVTNAHLVCRLLLETTKQ